MPNVLNEFTGDGVTRSFNFSMAGGYLSRDFVFFFTRPNDDLLNYTPYDDDNVTWLTDFSVQTSAPIPVGTTFVILRSTQLEPLVDFQNTSRITEKNLDTATAQAIHIASEVSDTVGRIQVVATDAKNDAADAMASAQQATADAAAAAVSAAAANAAASAAQAAALQAGLNAADAAQSAADASGVAATAASDAATALSTANASAATANTALTTANRALSDAGSAITTANAATNAASAATSTADSAALVAYGAASTANSAASTATSAMQLAEEAKELVDEAVSGAVVSFNGRAGTVTPQVGDYNKGMVGLGNVDNTSDLNKPISTATSNALGLKADTSYVNTQLGTKANATSVTNALALKADTTAVNTALSANATADRNRANHTGVQDMLTIDGLWTYLDNPTVQQSVNGGQLAGKRNLFVNGAMMLQHEGIGARPTLASGQMGADCWAGVSNNGIGQAFTVNCYNMASMSEQPIPGVRFATRLAVTTIGTTDAASYACIQTQLEGTNIARLFGRTFTMSFCVRGNKNGTASVSFRSGKATKAYTFNFSITTGWQRITITVPGGLPVSWTTADTDFDGGAGLQVIWTGLAGSQFRIGSPGSWVSGNVLAPTGSNYFTASNDWFDIAACQLEVGGKATAFEFQTYQEVLKEVNRYVYFVDSVGLMSVVGSGSWGGGMTNIQFPVRMRVPPTVALAHRVSASDADVWAGVADATFGDAKLVFTTDMSGRAGFAVYTLLFTAYL